MAVGLTQGLCSRSHDGKPQVGVEFGAFSVVAKDHWRGAAALVA
jgi:hypothetical protein